MAKKMKKSGKRGGERNVQISHEMKLSEVNYGRREKEEKKKREEEKNKNKQKRKEEKRKK